MRRNRLAILSIVLATSAWAAGIGVVVAACKAPVAVPEPVPTEQVGATFRLHILDHGAASQLSHEASQSEYLYWLNTRDVASSLLVLSSADVASARAGTGGMGLILTRSAARALVAVLNPTAEFDSTIGGNFSLGCLDEKAFVITIHNEPVVGGTFRCWTAMAYTHPEAYAITHDGQVMLGFSFWNTDSSVVDIVMSDRRPKSGP